MGLEKHLPRRSASRQAEQWRAEGKKVVFTNGCFDILHAGHIRYLRAARGLGDALIVGVNADESVRRLKGSGRPIQPEAERIEILCALRMVDMVVVFAEDTPLELICALHPDVLVKGGDWPIQAIVGHREVLAAGGQVYSLPFSEGLSTSRFVREISQVHSF